MKRKSHQWLSLMMRFEHAKKRVSRDKHGKIRLDLPYEFDREYERASGKNFKYIKEAAKREQSIVFNNGMIVLPNEVVRALFCDTIADIVKGVQEVIENNEFGKTIRYIFMVGGFSECQYLQDAIKERYGKDDVCTVLIPDEAQLAIIKGAVLYGHFQNQVISRIARKTYGIDCNVHFDSNVHPERKSFIHPDSGEKLCSGVLSVFVESSEEVQVGTCVEKEYLLYKSQARITHEIYSLSRKPNELAEFVDHEDMNKLGTITIETPNPDALEKRDVKVKMVFGSTEILVEATDVTSQNTCKTTIDFLSDI